MVQGVGRPRRGLAVEGQVPSSEHALRPRSTYDFRPHSIYALDLPLTQFLEPWK